MTMPSGQSKSAPRLTVPMRDALLRASREPLRRLHDDHPGAPPWPAPSASLRALVRRGLLEHRERRNRHGRRVEEWTATDAGLEALHPPPKVKRDTPRSLRVPGGSTMPMQAGVWVERTITEPEPVSPDDLDSAWFGEAARRHAEADDKRARARRLTNGKRAA